MSIITGTLWVLATIATGVLTAAIFISLVFLAVKVAGPLLDKVTDFLSDNVALDGWEARKYLDVLEVVFSVVLISVVAFMLGWTIFASLYTSFGFPPLPTWMQPT